MVLKFKRPTTFFKRLTVNFMTLTGQRRKTFVRRGRKRGNPPHHLWCDEYWGWCFQREVKLYDWWYPDGV